MRDENSRLRGAMEKKIAAAGAQANDQVLETTARMNQQMQRMTTMMFKTTMTQSKAKAISELEALKKVQEAMEKESTSKEQWRLEAQKALDLEEKVKSLTAALEEKERVNASMVQRNVKEKAELTSKMKSVEVGSTDRRIFRYFW